MWRPTSSMLLTMTLLLGGAAPALANPPGWYPPYGAAGPLPAYAPRWIWGPASFHGYSYPPVPLYYPASYGPPFPFTDYMASVANPFGGPVVPRPSSPSTSAPQGVSTQFSSTTAAGAAGPVTKSPPRTVRR